MSLSYPFPFPYLSEKESTLKRKNLLLGSKISLMSVLTLRVRGGWGCENIFQRVASLANVSVVLGIQAAEPLREQSERRLSSFCEAHIQGISD